MKMIIVNIVGGLGNQMFQYATGAALAARSKQKLKLDIASFEHYNLRNYELDVLKLIPKLRPKKINNDGIKYLKEKSI